MKAQLFYTALLLRGNIFVFSICIFLCSCSSKFSFQKRRYNKGFHISHSKTPDESTKQREHKTLALQLLVTESKIENAPTENLTPKNSPQITHSQIHAITHNLYVSKNFRTVAKSLKPAIKELKNLKKRHIGSESPSDETLQNIILWVLIICISAFASAITWGILVLLLADPKYGMMNESAAMVVSGFIALAVGITLVICGFHLLGHHQTL